MQTFLQFLETSTTAGPAQSASRSLSAFVIAGTHSGVGKTTVTLGLVAALRRRGIKVQPFKIGPDFIDPGLHRQAAEEISYNLDSWMLTRESNLHSFSAHSQRKEVAVVEGVMGLFDGYNGKSERGSTAEMVKWLGLPVLLVVDASAMARSAAALVLGFLRFDPKLKILGIIFNRIGGEGHLRYLKEAMVSLPETEVLGGLPYDEGITIPERHLGLRTAEEVLMDRNFMSHLADWIEKHLDLKRLLKKSRATLPAPKLKHENKKIREKAATMATIGIPHDAAFCFYYPDNLSLLKAAGARLVPFSPIRDRALPPRINALYLGGGYPELHARALAQNRHMRQAIKNFIESGGLVYAECGGFMYLTEALIDQKREQFPMVGIYPVKTRMLSQLKALGYREVKVKSGSFFPAGMRARGHEFHYSELSGDLGRDREIKTIYLVSGKGKKAEEGFLYKNCLASYVHLHFGSSPRMATWLVEACR
jgi:cobyrinic acid a,c-diamide synthase